MFPTSVERLRHLDPVTICLPSLLFAGTVCCLSHLDTRRVRCRSSLMALHLHCPRSEKREGMLKITITDTATEQRWTLQGRLVAPWVDELKTSWKSACRTIQGRRCIVNLDEVTFIDKRGEQMLRSMSSRGAQFVASDVYVNHVLDRLKRKSHRY